MKIHDALENTMSLLRKINAYLETKTPWKTVKEDNSEESSAATTLAISADILRIGSQLLQPVMPEKTTTILTILGAQNLPLSDTSVGTLKAGTILGEGKSPFPRIQTS
jgi:methionyl-tRNA synthetase